ncbi:MoaD/ThiS family protein [Microbacterium sp. NPDC091313]
MIRVRYFAAAAERAGADAEDRGETSLGALRSAMTTQHPALGEILGRCALLVDGVRADDDRELPDGATVDVLPPFAGG